MAWRPSLTVHKFHRQDQLLVPPPVGALTDLFHANLAHSRVSIPHSIHSKLLFESSTAHLNIDRTMSDVSAPLDSAVPPTILEFLYDVEAPNNIRRREQGDDRNDDVALMLQ